MEHHPFMVVPCAYLRLSEAARVACGVTRAELDEFLMYEFKVRRCGKEYPHHWMTCPYAHRGEKARRRDPRRFPHHGVTCPEFRQSGACRRGPRCEFAHGVFEFWLHPTRYRTRMCVSGPACARKICFFAHSADELRPEAVSQAGDVARKGLRRRRRRGRRSRISGGSTSWWINRSRGDWRERRNYYCNYNSQCLDCLKRSRS